MTGNGSLNLPGLTKPKQSIDLGLFLFFLAFRATFIGVPASYG